MSKGTDRGGDDPLADRFVLEHLLGAGATGQVYRARDQQLDRLVALKVLHHREGEAFRRSLLEARLQARMDHPHICQVYETGERHGRPFIAMQYLEGKSLDQVAADLSLRQKVELVRDVCRGVYAAHQVGLIHRDLKPTNIIVGRDDQGEPHPWIVDFGLATEMEAADLTATGVICGTPAYMAPEQIHGERSRSVDIWALGVILFEILSGRLPYGGRTSMEVLVKIIQDPPPPIRQCDPSIPPELGAVVDKALHREPEHRYASAELFGDDLENFLQGRPVNAKPQTFIYRSQKWIGRNRKTATALAALLLTLIAAGAFSFNETLRTRRTLEFARHFGEQAQDVEWKMRVVEMSPVHDIRGELEEIQRQMDSLANSIRRLGDLARGPGHFSLGRAHLALANWDKAKEEFEKALGARFREPQALLSLGLSLGEIYQREVEEARSIRNREMRELRLNFLAENFRDPARQNLLQGQDPEALNQGSMASQYYAQAFSAFLAEKWSEAIELTRKAANHRGWFYEAILLEGKIHLFRGYEARDLGEYEQAESNYQLARQSFLQATQVADSSIQAWSGLCGTAFAVLDLRTYYAGGELGEEADQGEVSCGRTTEIDPDRADLWAKRASISRLRARYAFQNGGKTESWIQQGRKYGSKALALDPQSAEAHRVLGLLEKITAQVQIHGGQDPRPALRKAIEHYQEAVELQDSAMAWSNLGLAQSSLARQDAFRGGDPLELFDQSVASQEKALELAPNLVPLHNNLSNVLKNKGLYILDHGGNPTPELKAAIEASTRAVELNPQYRLGWRTLALPKWYLADYYIQIGRDPSELLHEAISNLDQSIAIDPDYTYAWSDRGALYGLLGLWEMNHGRDPQTFLDQGLESVQKAQALDPKLPWPSQIAGVNRKDLGRWLLANQEDPTAVLDTAEQWFRQGLDIHSDDAYSLAAFAEIDLLRAEWALNQENNPFPFLRGAQKTFELGHSLDSDSPQIHFGEARAFFLESQWPLQTQSQRLQSSRKSEEFALRAWELDAGNPETPALLAAIHLYGLPLYSTEEFSHRLKSALSWSEKALAVNPSHLRAKGFKIIANRLLSEPWPPDSADLPSDLGEVLKENPLLQDDFEKLWRKLVPHRPFVQTE